MQLINLAPDPRNLACKVNLIAQNLAGPWVRAQGVERAVHDGRGGFLVIEDCERRGDHDYGEERERAEPAVRGADGGEGAVAAAFHEGARVGFWGGDEGAFAWAEGLPFQGVEEALRPYSWAGEHGGCWVLGEGERL